MNRENRYIVLKRKEVCNALSRDERALLDDLCRKVSGYRSSLGKAPMVCVVVESDWPEYEKTWGAIERRIDLTKLREVGK